ncbi:MAG: TPM domain-containing protein [Myxococcota bacterium]
MLLDDAGRQRVADAVAKAEATTSGELVCIVERQLEPDKTTPWLVGALAALAFPPPLLAAQLLLLSGGWTDGHGGPDGSLALLELVVLEGLVFAVFYGLARVPAVRRFVEPRSIRAQRVHDAALRHFVSRGVHQTRDRTGVLLFVAEEEHRAEIVADEGIYAKVDAKVWVEAIEALVAGVKQDDVVSGFERAIAMCGEVLAEHFPPRPDDIDELSNRLIVLD